MARLKSWRRILASGMLFAAVTIHTAGAAGQSAAPAQSGSPTYAIPLKDGNTAIVWWDAVSDPAHPTWRCEVPTPPGGKTARTATALSAAAGDWQAALAEARAVLADRAAVGE